MKKSVDDSGKIKPKRRTAKPKAVSAPVVETDVVSRADIARFARALAKLLGEGQSIVPALVAMADRESNATLQNTIRGLAARVRGGENLSQAMTHQSEVFEAADVEVVRFGEERNTLDDVLLTLAEDAERKDEKPVISVFEIADFTREFSALVSIGTSLVRSFVELEAKQRNPELKGIIAQINADVQAGETLSGAMRKFPQVFDENYINAVRSGEMSGTLDWTLQNLAHYDDILTFDQATQFLGTSKATLYRLLNENALKGLRVGRQWRFRKVDLAAYLEKKPDPAAHGDLEGIDVELKYFEARLHSVLPSNDEGREKIITLVNRILQFAIESQASDIHLEMARLDDQTVLLLRQRIDGVLHEIGRLSEKLSKPILNRFKVMADLSLEERHLPQDGRIHLKFQDKDFDLRVNFSPTAYGGSLVMRILDQSHNLIEFDRLGLHQSDAARLRDWLGRPNGLIVAAGPTNSGKTATLYAAMHLKLAPQIKTMSIEDPVEYALPYATQVHVNAKAGLTIASALRAFLRQDPDIILVAEIRDGEIAALANHAALSGHLILSSLHARSAADAARQLLDMGVQPFLVGSALIGTMAQRLARRICDGCREEYQPSAILIKQLRQVAKEGGYEMPLQSTFSHGSGCEKCRGTGYRGRIGLFEMLEVDERIAQAFLRGVGSEELQQIAVEGGMTTLAADGARKVKQGVTTVEEVLRVLFLNAAL